jgi:GntR family uxuAB operon transcriptional repressor
MMNALADQKLGAADIAALIRREISKGSLQLHDRLPPERVLSETYGAARGTIRKALTHLEKEGFVETRAGSGTYVVHKPDETSTNAIRNATPLELMDTRFALEPHICRLAVLHGRHADFDRMEDLCNRMEECLDDPVGFSEADTDFHRALAECTRNGLLIWILDQIANVRSEDDWTRMRHLTLDSRTIGIYNVQHRQILNAVRTREPERAANIMKEHLETARLSLTRASET